MDYIFINLALFETFKIYITSLKLVATYKPRSKFFKKLLNYDICIKLDTKVLSYFKIDTELVFCITGGSNLISKLILSYLTNFTVFFFINNTHLTAFYLI